MRVTPTLNAVFLSAALLAAPAVRADSDGDLLAAAGGLNVAAARSALATGADVDAKASDGTTALMLAVDRMNTGIVRLLLARAAGEHLVQSRV